jgi:hypothetical protein
VEVSVDPASRGSQFRLDTVLAVGVGGVLGLVARNLPFSAAALAFPAERDRSCDEATLDCAVAEAPGIIGGLVVFGFLGLLVAVGFAAVGVLLVARGVRPPAPSNVAEVASERRTVVQFAQASVGTALVVPAIWLVVAFVVSS